MLRSTVLALGVLLFSSTAFGQTASTDSQTLQALLTEVHQLRQDLQTAATAARRAQILIYRLYAQESVVAHASQRVDEAKSVLDELENRKKWSALRIKEYEDTRDRAENATQRKQFDDLISRFKSEMEDLVPVEQEAQTKEMELAEQLRVEQVKLDQLQAELDQLDRVVMSAASRLGSIPH
ncbi:MAG TPA: hypothetical protein VI431_06220 [Candidatus Acidoferrum sp.]